MGRDDNTQIREERKRHSSRSREYSPERKYHKTSYRDRRDRETDEHGRYSSRDRYDDSSRYYDDKRASRRDNDVDRYHSRDRDYSRRQEHRSGKDERESRDYYSSRSRDDQTDKKSKKNHHNYQQTKKEYKERSPRTSSQKTEETPATSSKPIPNTYVDEKDNRKSPGNATGATDEYLEKLSLQMQKKEKKDDPLRAVEERRRKRQELIKSLDPLPEKANQTNPPCEEEKIPTKTIPDSTTTDHTNENSVSIIKRKTSSDNKMEIANTSKEEEEEEEIDLFGDDPIPNDPEPTNISDFSWDNSVEEDWDDSDGYMRYRIGETMNEKYRITGTHGKGVFSQVLKVEEINTNAIFAVKINRNNETMKRAGEVERDLLQRMKDKSRTRSVIMLHDSFEYKKHLCIVLESMEYNLREVIQTFGGGIGITLQAVRFYTRQILTGLKHMKQCNILHADIKPDNIVVSTDKRTLKICDFGTASDIDSPENEITPLLVSRYYRPPEVILGLKYDEQVDLWSVACCIVEMYTGQILFAGKDNNEMIRMFMEVKGKFSKKMLKRGMFSSEYFDEQGYFLCQKEEPGTKRIITQRVLITQESIDLMRLLVPGKPLPDNEMAEVRQLKDLLQKMFVLDPTKRISVEAALIHPFVIGNTS